MTLKEGEIINGRYRLVKERGRGTFGEVWQAWDDILDMEVAIKIYIALDSRGIDEFKSEYKTTFSLTHPNLLHASHFDVVEKRPYLVMPYCPESADELVGKISEEEAWRFIRDVSSGLAYLHSKNIIHRDIKPDNILRDANGDFLISDFGVSVKMRSTLRKNSVRDLSESTTQGTIGYMGPEMFTTNPSAVKATDIWALGATVYEMLEEEMPFFGQGGVMQLHGGEIPDLKGPWSDSLKSTVAACLSKDTWERPKAEDLEWYASDIIAGRLSVLPWEAAWQKKKEDDERGRQEAERRRIEEERRAEEARLKALEEERKRREEEILKAETEKRRQEEERKKAEAEKRRKDEETRKVAEEERRRKEEEKRHREEERRIKEQAEREKKEEIARQKAEAKAAKAEEKQAKKSKGWLWIIAVAAAAATGVFIWSPRKDAQKEAGTINYPGGPMGQVSDTLKPKDAIAVDSVIVGSVSDKEQAVDPAAEPESAKKELVRVAGVTINKTDLTLEEGDRTQLIATVHPVGASDKSVKWKSSDPSIATVSSKGYVSAKAEGITMITVTTVDGRKTAECSVTVDAKSQVPEKPPVLEPVQPQAQPKPIDWAEIKKQADAGDGKACYEYANHCLKAGQNSSVSKEKLRLFSSAYDYAEKAVRHGESRGSEIMRTLKEKEQFDKSLL